jgi:ankyrin repeat protein
VLKSCKIFTTVVFLCLIFAPLSAQTESDLDAFFRAVTDGRADFVASSLESHPEWVERELFFGIRPLYRASVLGRAEIAQLLLESGAEVSAATDRGNQPLHAATQNGHLAVVMILIAHKAHLDAPDEAGLTPLHLAARYKQVGALKELLRNGADPNVFDRRGRSPLHLAAGLGRLDLVVPLVEAGAELSPVDDDGYSPLGWTRTCKRNSFGDVGGYLEAKGADDIRPPSDDDDKRAE